jgi:nitrate/nitrite transporter NarK
VVWGGAWLGVMRDWPHQAEWMSAEAREQLDAALAHEQVALPRMENFWLAFRERNVVRLCANYFFWSLGIYGFVLWLPVVIRNATRIAIDKTGLLATLPYLVGVILMLVVAHLSDKSGKRRGFVWPLLVLGGAALAGSYFSVAHSFAVAYACLIVAGSCMYAPYGPFWAMVPELLPRNVAGQTMALINCCGALGGFFGVLFVGFLQARTGSPAAGFLLMSLSLILSGVLLLRLEPVALSR